MVQAVQTPETSSFADGVTATFPTVWSFEDETEVVVSVEIGTAAPVVKTPGVDYDVLPGDWLTYGSSIQFRAGAIPPNGARVIRRRRTTADQPVGYGDLATFRPRQNEGSFDKLTRQSQEHGARLDRAVKVPVGDSAPTVPRAAQRAGRLAIFDAEGDFDPNAPTLEALANPVASATAAAAAAAASAASAEAAAGAVGEDRNQTLAARDEAVAAALAVSGAVESVTAATAAGVAAVSAQALSDKTSASAAIAADRDSALSAISADKAATLTAKADAITAKNDAVTAKQAAEAAANSLAGVTGTWAAIVTGAMPDPVSQAMNLIQSAWPSQPPRDVLAIYLELIDSLMTAGLWAKRDIIKLECAHSEAAGKVNLRNPGFADWTPFNAPVFTPYRGWDFNGSNQYLSAGKTPAQLTQYTLHSASFFAESDEDVSENKYIVATNSSSAWPASAITMRQTTGKMIAVVNESSITGLSSAAVPSAAGLVLANRTGPVGGPSSLSAYRNGAAVPLAANPNATGVPTTDIRAGGTGFIGSAVFSTQRLRASGWGAGLTPTEAAAEAAIISKAVAALAAYA